MQQVERSVEPGDIGWRASQIRDQDSDQDGIFFCPRILDPNPNHHTCRQLAPYTLFFDPSGRALLHKPPSTLPTTIEQQINMRTPLRTILFTVALLCVCTRSSHGFFSTQKSVLCNKSNIAASFLSPPRTRLAQQQQPNFGDWTNDDYLNNLSGSDDYDGDGGGAYSGNYNEEQQNYAQQNEAPANNNLTDEEITAWALNSAQFYNTDVSVQEAYGVKRDGPPRREEGTEVDGW